MKTLYVTISEFGAIQEGLYAHRLEAHPIHEALKEVLGHEIAERAIGGVRIEVVTELSDDKQHRFA
jgi:hypothetical protein